MPETEGPPGRPNHAHSSFGFQLSNSLDAGKVFAVPSRQGVIDYEAYHVKITANRFYRVEIPGCPGTDPDEGADGPENQECETPCKAGLLFVERLMPHPICGKCGSSGVYQDRTIDGQRFIVCIICGNRYPGNKEGFYMSDKAERSSGSEVPEAAQHRRLCITCEEKPTISDSCPYCPSCMRKRMKKKPGRKPGRERVKPISTAEDKRRVKKTAVAGNMAVVIDFSKYPAILTRVQDLAADQIRPVDAQIIYLLKSHFEGMKQEDMR